MKNKEQRLYLDEILRVLDPMHRDLAPQIGARSYSQATIKSIDKENRTVQAVVSTPNVDRYEEIVTPQAFAKWLPNFMKNPVLVAGHTYIGTSGEPTVIGHWLEMKITDQGLVGTCKFMENDELAEKWWQRVLQGAIRAFSVGWLTHDWEMQEFEITPGVFKTLRVFTLVELIEVSLVAIPANRESLIRAASKQLGMGGQVKDLALELEPLIKRAIEQTLTDPIGPIAGVIQDAVDAALGHRSHYALDGSDPVPAPGGGVDDSKKASDELKHSLRLVTEQFCKKE